MSRGIVADIARIAILVVTLVFFFAPLVSSAVFGFSLPGIGATTEPLTGAVAQVDFWTPLRQSLLLAVLTTLASFALLVPTLLLLHLRLPRWLPIAEGLSVLPYVVPVVALVTGANTVFRAIFPAFLTSIYSLIPFYVIVTMPLVYRALDNGLRALDVRTLVSASTSLGAGPVRTVVSVIVPNMRPALLTAALLSATLVVGEFVLAQLLLHNTYPVLLNQLGQDAPRAAAALAVLTILGTWILLSAGSRVRVPGRRVARTERVPS